MQTEVPGYIQSLTPYAPGKPIEETKRELGIRTVMKLASNENPLGPSPKGVGALRKQLKEIHRYPDGSAYRLKAALSSHLNVQADQIFVGNGSNEVFELVIRTFGVPGDVAVAGDGAFIPFRIACQAHGLKVVEPALKENLTFDLPAMVQAARDHSQCKMIYLPNPNNPTGTYNTTSEVREFLKEVQKIRKGSVLVILDYAYWEYVTAKDFPDALELWREFPNVIVTRTFSKIYGLAALRVGYGIAQSSIIENLNRVRLPFNVNSLGLIAAEAALGDKGFVRRSQQANRAGLKQLTSAFDRLGIEYWDSQANFVLIDTFDSFGRSAKEVFDYCLRKGVILRPVYVPGRAGALRVSVGLKTENARAIKVFESFGKSVDR